MVAVVAYLCTLVIASVFWLGAQRLLRGTLLTVVLGDLQLLGVRRAAVSVVVSVEEHWRLQMMLLVIVYVGTDVSRHQLLLVCFHLRALSSLLRLMEYVLVDSWGR